MGFPTPVAQGTQAGQYHDPLQQYILDMMNQPQPDFAKLAQDQLGPAYQAQLAAITNAQSQAKQQATAGDAQLAAMYKALGIDIGKNASNLNNIFNTGYGTVNAAYAGGKQDANRVFDQGQANTQALLAKFGIEAAAPDALAQSYSNEALINGILNANQQAANNSLGISRAGDLAFNTAQQNIAGYEGAQQRSSLQSALQKILSQYQQQAIQASGNYNSQLAQRQYDLQNSYLQNQQQLENQAYQSYADQLKMQQQQGQSQTPSISQQWNMMGPVDKGYYQASQLFGPNNAGAAMQIVMKAGQQNPQNGFDMVQKAMALNSELRKTNPAQAVDDQALQSLAAFMYEQIKPSYNPYGNAG